LILYRCFAWSERARAEQADSPLWFPRVFQGDGRHDNPDVYGCLYASDSDTATVVEQLARYQGSVFLAGMLSKRGSPLGLAEIQAPDDGFIDLDAPATLTAEGLRPSLVATHERSITQSQALDLHERHRDAAGLRWWSTFEALWTNLTIFDRARTSLRLVEVRALTPDDPAVIAATDFLGMSA
jgi:hypothetical protein